MVRRFTPRDVQRGRQLTAAGAILTGVGLVGIAVGGGLMGSGRPSVGAMRTAVVGGAVAAPGIVLGASGVARMQGAGPGSPSAPPPRQPRQRPGLAVLSALDHLATLAPHSRAMDPSSIARLERGLLPALARYFRLELHGATASIPPWDRQPCIFIMNHTAILGLEVYLLYAALRELHPGRARPRTTVWPPFLEMPLLGGFYRASGCVPMSVEGASQVLLGGESVLILPEGPDATDVRDELGPFHAGFLRVVKKLADEHGLEVPIVPLGWSGVDEANPWWVITQPLVVQALMKPMMPRFDFALLPRLPILRPSKVVFVAGEPVRLGAAELASEAGVRAELAQLRSTVRALMEEASALRRERIEASPFERVLHAVTGSRNVSWDRRPPV